MKKLQLMKWLSSAAVTFAAAAASLSLSAGAAWERIAPLGDLNSDNKVNVADMVVLSRHLHGTEELGERGVFRTLAEKQYAIEQNDHTTKDAVINFSTIQRADVNQDGVVDVLDLIRMRKCLISAEKYEYIAEWHPDIITTTTTTTATTTSTTTTTIAPPPKKDFISAPVYDMYGTLPSQGESRLLIFYVDFPDCKFSYEPTMERVEEIAFGPENRESDMYPFESFSAFYARSSKGDMRLSGNAYRYTCKKNISSYEGDVYKSDFTTEVIKNMNDIVDYSRFDADNDGVVDAILFCVPGSSDEDEWWPCAGGYYGDYWLRLDGKTFGHVITGNADITSDSDYIDFTTTYLHEMGHCMGLPDYYLYERDDFEGLNGSAGYDLMDEAYSDFTAISKLMLGWYREDQIMVYDSSKGEQSFTLTNAQTNEGNCLIIPRGQLDPEYKSEYFILEYSTLEGNNSKVKSHFWWRPTGSGVRLLHIEATEMDDGWRKYFMYESGNHEYTNHDDGKRFIRLVNDGADKDNFLRNGSVVDSSVSGFMWYNDNGVLAVDPQLTIKVSRGARGEYTVTVAPK